MSRTRATALAGALALGMSFAATAAVGAPNVHHEQTLYTFRGGSDGTNPTGPLLADAQGNLYGTTTFGGGMGLCGYNPGCGTVFKLTPSGAGYSESVLYAFNGSADGGRPNGGLIMDASGAIYGTLSSYGPAGYGSVFKLTRTGGTTYTETILYAFTGSADGDSPSSGLAMDPTGALYGTTYYGGSGCAPNQLCGTVYKLTPISSGYTKALAHTFLGGSDGAGPAGNVFLDKSGALYGTTVNGGVGCGGGCGTVFRLTPNGSSYTESVLYRFPGQGGELKGEPDGIAADAGGNLYVSTYAGGVGGCPNFYYGCGSAIKLTPSRSAYRESRIYDFRPNMSGVHPSGQFVVDATGAIYGTTGSGGSRTCVTSDYVDRGCGGIFKITPTASGNSYQELYRFKAREGNGPGPLIADSSGGLYGTANAGGTYGWGTVFKYTP
jgi:uncharacterized repeat protein (TIGR03803 family)